MSVLQLREPNFGFVIVRVYLRKCGGGSTRYYRVGNVWVEAWGEGVGAAVGCDLI